MHTHTTVPHQMRHLPWDAIRGVPVPWFVQWIDGKPEFRVADSKKLRLAVSGARCWVCGNSLRKGRQEPLMTFILGPMCTINRVSSEPPCHYECALYSAQNCPFLTRRSMDRREGGMDVYEAAGAGCAGVMIKRNPGCAALWKTHSYKLEREGRGVLFRIGEPVSVEWFAEGRPARRHEVVASIESGLPILEEMAHAQPGALAELRRLQVAAMRYLPRA